MMGVNVLIGKQATAMEDENVQMEVMKYVSQGLGFAMEKFSQGHSHVFRIPGMKKKSIWGEKI